MSDLEQTGQAILYSLTDEISANLLAGSFLVTQQYIVGLNRPIAYLCELRRICPHVICIVVTGNNMISQVILILIREMTIYESLAIPGSMNYMEIHLLNQRLSGGVTCVTQHRHHSMTSSGDLIDLWTRHFTILASLQILF